MWKVVVNSLASHGQPLLKFDEAPEYLKTNPYIRTGYRSPQSWSQCLRSVLSLHNETLNIWTHLLGFFFFLTLLVWDWCAPPSRVTWQDFAVILTIITLYQVCMIMSAVFHTFTSHSEEASEFCLQMDLAGIGASVTASYISGIYYAFWCSPSWCSFYLATVVGFIFCGALARNLLNKEENFMIRLVYFVSFVVWGCVPTIHWAIMNGGIYNDEVRIFLPRIIFMYLICGVAFLFYIAKFPEICLPGKFDIFGSSHQWWHVIIWVCLAYWHHTSFTFAEFRLESGCGQGLEPEIKQRLMDKFWINF
eukprot:GFUD01000879.1.p1 GENE.GFUD01000879.1~~GFUD01000879.1.p1  ORF type:complete len:306 (-),score=77.57 GFUD01000879.1:100-1017(-)